MNRLDYKGLNCPQPVMEAKKFLDNHPNKSPVTILVDNKAASENVSRFLTSQGYETHVSDDHGDFQITGHKSGERVECEVVDEKPMEKNTLVFFAHNTIGTGNKELGAKLMTAFVKTLPEIKDSLWRLVFVNEGVTLTIENSESLSVLKDLEDQGVSILVCGTCLDFFNLLDQKMVGETTNMLDIMTSLQVADKVINL